MSIGDSVIANKVGVGIQFIKIKVAFAENFLMNHLCNVFIGKWPVAIIFDLLIKSQVAKFNEKIISTQSILLEWFNFVFCYVPLVYKLPFPFVELFIIMSIFKGLNFCVKRRKIKKKETVDGLQKLMSVIRITLKRYCMHIGRCGSRRQGRRPSKETREHLNYHYQQCD